MLLAVLAVIMTLSGVIGTAHGKVEGITGPTFNLIAKEGYIYTTDGASHVMWGYGSNGDMQYPGPTLLVNQGDTVTINLTNQLTVATSMVFPGQLNVVETGGTPGLLAREAGPNGGTVSYSFTATKPGTYTYYSGTAPELQVEMGLLGAIVVYPTGFTVADKRAYDDPSGLDKTTGSYFDREYLFLVSEMDPNIHQMVQLGKTEEIDFTESKAVHWFVTGRDGPDTVAESFHPSLPFQPYGSLARMRIGEYALMRIVGGGKDPHPFHCHGNQHNQIAREGRVLRSNPTSGPIDLQESVFTTPINPGQTVDARFLWQSVGIGFDVFGHVDPTGQGLTGQACVDAGVPLVSVSTPEYTYTEPLEDHCRAIPVVFPSVQSLVVGQFYSGTPYLGGQGSLPPGEGGFNPTGGYFFMWHSHAEKELTTNNIFPGGMLTFGIVEHPETPIVE